MRAAARSCQLDRRKDVDLDEDGVGPSSASAPASIPDYLALVGDSADGFPGLPGWGAKSAAAVLARYGTSRTSRRWPTTGTSPSAAPAAGRRAARATLELALLFRRIATLEYDAA